MHTGFTSKLIARQQYTCPRPQAVSLLVGRMLTDRAYRRASLAIVLLYLAHEVSPIAQVFKNVGDNRDVRR
jgi:hypothetical protein